MTETEALLIVAVIGIAIGTAIGLAIPRKHVSKWLFLHGRCTKRGT